MVSGTVDRVIRETIPNNSQFQCFPAALLLSGQKRSSPILLYQARASSALRTLSEIVRNQSHFSGTLKNTRSMGKERKEETRKQIRQILPQSYTEKHRAIVIDTPLRSSLSLPAPKY